MRFFILAYLVVGIVFISSCSYKQTQVLFEKRDRIDSTAQKPAETLATYKIQPQDVLQLRNLQNMSYILGDGGSTASGGTGGAASGGQSYQVEEDGTVALPVIGHVQVAGLTRVEATKQIEDLYRKTLLKDPIIELKIVNLKVTILGEIRAQGNYILVKDKTTLVEMIGEAGGLTDKANEKNVEIIRGTENNPKITVVNLNDISSISDPSTVLRNGDIIYIAQNKRAIRSDRLQDFSTISQPILLILSTAILIFTLARH